MSAIEAQQDAELTRAESAIPFQELEILKSATPASAAPRKAADLSARRVSLAEGRRRLRDYEARDWRGEDFDLAAKQAKAQGMTFRKWLQKCLAETEKKSVNRDPQHVTHLEAFLADPTIRRG